MSKGWIGVDLDGTLAKYDGWKHELHVGEPVPAMVNRVRGWLEQGYEVKVFTARVSDRDGLPEIRKCIQAWCLEHVGVVLPVTNVKDYAMIELWDDRCVAVEPNTGRALSPSTRGL